MTEKQLIKRFLIGGAVCFTMLTITSIADIDHFGFVGFLFGLWITEQTFKFNKAKECTPTNWREFANIFKELRADIQKRKDHESENKNNR